jgi:hypothetical protein
MPALAVRHANPWRGHASRVSTAPVATQPRARTPPRRGAASTQPNAALPVRPWLRPHDARTHGVTMCSPVPYPSSSPSQRRSRSDAQAPSFLFVAPRRHPTAPAHRTHDVHHRTPHHDVHHRTPHPRRPPPHAAPTTPPHRTSHTAPTTSTTARRRHHVAAHPGGSKRRRVRGGLAHHSGRVGSGSAT